MGEANEMVKPLTGEDLKNIDCFRTVRDGVDWATWDRAVATIRQEQAEVERLRDALTEAPMYALGHTHGFFANWCMEQAQPTGQEVGHG